MHCRAPSSAPKRCRSYSPTNEAAAAAEQAPGEDGCPKCRCDEAACPEADGLGRKVDESIGGADLGVREQFVASMLQGMRPWLKLSDCKYPMPMPMHEQVTTVPPAWPSHDAAS